ncbi:UDP-glucose 4-epimerase GalE [Phycisphaera mikurensis]|uniref:UDP-glucose 4-epimerase n=1 Tax=Phycisphaera mikurensis (strain NBRC 102666 / KCTC 22515 / FYK2301M01) TaxID=1142394 RepID=I0ID90_PHYMF|nr:UDP-glucose 4-epimerase GalE [Phycisphaera mikurensis]MBB6442353.1 UDP-glucose 4-epimerase [Phycisphaera mikurensis]BAM03228.1 UDP-glucose 4-epimerase [Phycisphaera mikurensis NBRC 102666]
MKVLVTGGAGYIGSHAVQRLLRDGHDVAVLDNLGRGHREAVEALRASSGKEIPLLEADLQDRAVIAARLRELGTEAIMNFAALAYVGESVTDPLRYYENNTAGVVSLLQAMQDAGVKRFVHSSTCATYGEPEVMPIREDTPQSPINPYGWSKLFVERVLADHAAAEPGFAYAALRYFNVAGSDPDAVIGEDHHPETHLIPVLLNTALGKRESATIFGLDYPTPDGTCIRDYIHVSDLIDAHVAVMNELDPDREDRRQMIFNLGTGKGLSVKQIIDAVKEVTGVDFPVEHGDRRPGDPPSLYADPRKIREQLGWSASITDATTMVRDAWKWFQENPSGYASQA